MVFQKAIELQSGEKIISKTDLKGRITDFNDRFVHYAQYRPEELMGAPHNIVRHRDMPAIAFRLLWAKVRDGQEVNAFVKNQPKNPTEHYWVYAKVMPTLSRRTGRIESCYSIRQRANPDAVVLMEVLYKLLLDLERDHGYRVAKAALKAVLDHHDLKFNHLMSRLQAQGGGDLLKALESGLAEEIRAHSLALAT